MDETISTVANEEGIIRSRWNDALQSLLAKRALHVGAGNPTDAGVGSTQAPIHPNPIELSGGIPDPMTLPVDDLRDSFDRVLASTPREALRYGGVQGFEGLRAALAERQGALEGIQLAPENFIITNGSAGAISTICDTFLNPGDVIIIENPTFSGTIRTVRGHQAEIISIPLDQNGVQVEQIASAMDKVQAAGKRVKLVYTISEFHNPTGTTLSTERKADLIRLCSERETLIVEDAAYSEIFFAQRPLQSLFSMARGQGVLRVGTFSKVIATGLRLGWVQGETDYINALTNLRFDMGGSPVLQRAVTDYIERGKLDAHVEIMRSVYAKKCETICRSLEHYCASYTKFTRPLGGFFLWAECLGVSAQNVANEAIKEGLRFPIGSLFFLNGVRDDSTHIRLAFATATLEQLEEVGQRLRKASGRARGEQ